MQVTNTTTRVASKLDVDKRLREGGRVPLESHESRDEQRKLNYVASEGPKTVVRLSAGPTGVGKKANGQVGTFFRTVTDPQKHSGRWRRGLFNTDHGQSM